MAKRKPLLVLACLLGAGMIVSCGTPNATSSENKQTSSSQIQEGTSEEASSSETKASSEASSTSESASSSSEQPISSSSSEAPVTSSSSEEPIVATTVEAYIEDEYKLFSGNPLMSVNSGDYVEVTPNAADGKYTFTIGARIRMAMVSNGYIVPTGATINGVSYKINSSGYINFIAEENDDSTTGDTTMHIVAEYEDTTPSEKAYKIEVTNSANITLHVYNENKNAEITSCDMNDVVYIKAEVADGYKVKSISGYTIQDSIGTKKTFEIKYSEEDGYYSFTCPFSANETISITVEEIDATAFANSDLIGDYLIVRTFSLAGYSNINQFNGYTLSINESGEMVYGSDNSSTTTMYMQDEQNDTVSVKNGTSSVTMYKGSNIIIFGHAGTGSSIITPLSGDSTDISVAIKKKEGTAAEDYTMKNNAFTVDSVSYAVFSFYLNEELYASCYITTNNKQIVTDVNLKMYCGTKAGDDKAVYDVLKGSDKLLSVGYADEGGNSNRAIITDFANGYTNTDHTLVFTSNTTALYDDASYNVTVEESDIKLLSPTKEVHITLNSDMSFTVVSETEVEKHALNIANKVFEGSYIAFDEAQTTTITFGDSNDNITAKILSQDYFKYYWDFSATFDSSTNILTATVTDRGYSGQTANTAPDIGTQFTILLEDGKLTFKENWTGNNAYKFKNCVFTCADFTL